ncbi:TRAP transporter small permease [Alcaligenes sp. 13f]|uniref:TRAP transporter small permease n=1 Tax=Alcaligenes sp. 13f TaxID=2841924 RepID=UPI001CF6FA0C|nr:TRAP transporter small permease [Alcaligenes sp. 13f]MCB4320704.1 TRAP transporter small permease [Alcaligenes sp. 13f]
MDATNPNADSCLHHSITRVLEIASTVARWISRFSLLVMTAIIGWQVFARYVLNDSPSWSESTSILLMGWFVIVGAGAGVRSKDHLGFIVVLIMLPPTLRRWISGLGNALIALFGSSMAFFGMDLVLGTWHVIMPGNFLPQGAHYIPLVVGGVLIFLFGVENVLADIQRKVENKLWSN